MSRAKVLLNPELARFIREKFPVARKRSALWFFTNELKNNLTLPTTTTPSAHRASVRNSEFFNSLMSDDKSVVPQSDGSTGVRGSRLSRNKMLQIWKNMDPESKRKYFNMAEFDELRFEEQKSQWISEVGMLLQQYSTIDQVSEMAPSHDRLQNKFFMSLDKLQKNYEQMIQTESTKMIYKDAVKRVDKYTHAIDSGKLISSVPKHHRAILLKPRRPPPAFVLYFNDNIDRYKQIRSETKTKDTYMRICANEWNELDDEVKRVYDERYEQLKEDYDRAMEAHREELLASADNYLQSASREKKNFKRSLRRRLRDASLRPVSIRNAFNFFVMEKKDVKLSDLTQIWRELPTEEKTKYIQMNQEDVTRYQREAEAYNEVRKILNELVGSRRSKSESGIK